MKILFGTTAVLKGMRRSQAFPRNLAVGMAVGLLTLCVTAIGWADESTDLAAGQFFEQHIRPLLMEKCSGCHGSEEQSSGLRVDSYKRLLRGGDTAPAIVPGNPSESLIIRAVRGDGELAMPPDGRLSDGEIQALADWIAAGAVWPKGMQLLPTANESSSESSSGEHWAFQPLRAPVVPQVETTEWIKNPIDALVWSQLASRGLRPSLSADRRTLIRRATYTLTGLPPSPAAVDRFVNDQRDDAYQLLVEQLLASPQYGEHWARHWLDVARYSDTKGYVYAREERFWVHAWAYRDWVIEALNRDLPYDRFLLLQLAADQVTDRQANDLAAMGFLTLGRRFLGVRRDIIDDRIDVVCRGTMGLTVSCARCHDHKYDPIPAADYYSLYGVFDSCVEQQVALANTDEHQDFARELQKRQEKLKAQMVLRRRESADRVRDRVSDYLYAQFELHKYPANGFDQVFEKHDILPAFVRRWERYLRASRLAADPVFVAWHAYADVASETFAQDAIAVTSRLQRLPPAELHPLVAQAFARAPNSRREVCDRYAVVFKRIEERWQQTRAEAAARGESSPTQFTDADAEALRSVLYADHSPCEVPPGPIVQTETYFDSASCTELWKLQGEVDRWIINSGPSVPFGLLLVDQDRPIEPRIFLRGDPLKPGPEVPRQFLSVLAPEDRQPFSQGSGRFELAQAIIDPRNPLTPRVIVNRIWMHCFGQGLVSTPSDFGRRAAQPTHPELLDWLACELIAQGWSLKQLHRAILMSATFQQASFGQATMGSGGGHTAAQAIRVDPDNRLLWHYRPRRLTFEEFRDSLLVVSQQLDGMLGGKPFALFAQPAEKRRTLYGLVDRQFLPGSLRMFDFANPDLHVSKRNETTVPQQALFLMNHPLVVQRAEALGAMASAGADRKQSVVDLFRHILQRAPTDGELMDALALVDEASQVAEEQPARSVTAKDWQYGFGTLDASVERVENFTQLPHFTGQAWQGGASWPDAELGWVQLTAEGGHPGNDRDHAAVRRWTAPGDMTIAIDSQFTHEPEQGDGVRVFIVSSREGVLESCEVHHASRAVNVDFREVTRRETIDFLVDIDEQLNSDQYLWTANIRRAPGSDGISDVPSVWKSKSDFTRESRQELRPWAQLAQVLLCANEFMFVD